VLLDVALDLVLDQAGRDGVEHRAEDDMLHSFAACGVDDAEAHVPLPRMQGGTDVVDLLGSTNGAREYVRVAEVADDHLAHTERAQLRG